MAVIVSGDSAILGKPFTFDGTQSRSGSAPITTYQWEMGNGSTLFGAAIQHGYTRTGVYTVTLTITDADGQNDTTTRVVEVIDSAEATPTVAPTAEGAFTLIGTSWLMENAVRGTTVTLVFGEEKLSGSSGCNDYSAGYTATVTEGATANISVGTISTGNQSCTQEVMAQERGYLESLTSASRVAVEGTTLTIETDSGSLTFGQTENNE
jgi:heat shock protein HslJ